MKQRVLIFARVSSKTQDTDRQINELIDYCTKQDYELVQVLSEDISGAVKIKDRLVYEELMQLILHHKINRVLVWELSRIGRSTVDILNLIELLTENKISLYIHNYNLETLNHDLKPNPLTNFMVQVLSSVSEMERLQIVDRIRSGYNNYRNKGGKVGRKIGFQKDQSLFLEENKEVIKLLNKDYSFRNISKITGKSLGTINKVKKILL